MPRCPRCGSKETETSNGDGKCKWCGKEFYINPFDPEGQAT